MNREAFEVKKFWQEYQAAVLRQDIPKAKVEWYGRWARSVPDVPLHSIAGGEEVDPSPPAAMLSAHAMRTAVRRSASCGIAAANTSSMRSASTNVISART